MGLGGQWCRNGVRTCGDRDSIESMFWHVGTVLDLGRTMV